MKLVTAVCLLLLITSAAEAQKPKWHPEYTIACRGWSIIPFAGQESKIKDREPTVVDGVEAQVKWHEFPEELIVFLESCDPEARSKPEGEDPYYGRYRGVVRGFESYEVNGRVFAYSFTYFVVMARDGYVTARAGAAGNISYVDKKGDGTFERSYEEMPMRFPPDWVKAAKQ
jgi:hypothetical protein